MKVWVLILLALLLTAGRHQYDLEYDEWRDVPCPIFDKVEEQYERDILIYDWLGWGDFKEIEATRWKLNRLREIESHVCLEI